jgi:prophage regulatory protein
MRDMQTPKRFIRLKEVMKKTGLSRATVYRFVGMGTFPSSCSIGDRAVAWVEADVDLWIEQKIAARRAA